MPNILVTNDDGVTALGLLALADALAAVGAVTVIAPERNWSAAGHPKTLHKPLRLKRLEWPNGRQVLACSGAPSDCVALGLLGAAEVAFDLVVSGVNSTFNLGSDVIYSGTVAGAMEAIINGVPAIAVSVGAIETLEIEDEVAYTRAAAVAGQLARWVLGQGLPERTLLNVNVPRIPAGKLKGIQVTRLGQRIYRDVLVARDDPWGRPYYWLGGEIPTGVPETGSDIGAVETGWVSVTPLGVDLTHFAALDVLNGWDLSLEGVE